MTDVKICGLTRPEDVRLAAELGAASIGFNFAAGSSRRVSLDRARELALAAPEGVLRVGVFVGEDESFISEAIEAGRLDLVQLHRPLGAADERIDAPLVAVVHVGREPPAPFSSAWRARCRALLFDSERPSRSGGTGTCFDWALVSGHDWPLPVWLAGGLTPENVSAAVRRVRPEAVDTASGVESAPGVKDPDRMARFFEAVREADELPGGREA